MKFFGITFAIAAATIGATEARKVTLAQETTEVIDAFRSLNTEAKSEVAKLGNELALVSGLNLAQLNGEKGILNIIMMIITLVNNFHSAVESVGGEKVYVGDMHTVTSVILKDTIGLKNMSAVVDTLLNTTVHLVNTDTYNTIQDTAGLVIKLGNYMGPMLNAFGEIKLIIQDIIGFMKAPKSRKLLKDLHTLAVHAEKKNVACVANAAASALISVADLGEAEFKEIAALVAEFQQYVHAEKLNVDVKQGFEAFRTQIHPALVSVANTEGFKEFAALASSECFGNGRQLSKKVAFNIEKIIIFILNIVEAALEFAQKHLIFKKSVVESFGVVIEIFIKMIFRKNEAKQNYLVNATGEAVKLLGTDLNGTLSGLIVLVDGLKVSIVPDVAHIITDLKTILGAAKELIAMIKKIFHH